MLNALKFIAALFFIISCGAKAQNLPNTALYLDYEERVIAAYLLLAAGEPIEKQNEIIERAKQHALQVQKKGVLEVKVSSFAEFMKWHRGEWPNAHSVEATLQVIENSEIRPMTYVSSDIPEVQRRINQYHIQRNEFLKKKFGYLVPVIQAYRQAIVTGAVAAPVLTGKLQELFTTHSVEFIQTEFQRISSLGKELLSRNGGQKQADGFNTFISFAISEYFQNLSLNSQKQIISQTLGEDIHADPIHKFQIMVLNSGPNFQKLLQVVARESTIPEDMLLIFKRLESMTMPVNNYFVQKIIQSELHNYHILEFEQKPLGVGTMAQVHKAVIQTENGPRNVVIRFIKPGIEERLFEDHEILMKLAPVLDAKPELIKANFTKLAPVAEELTQTLIDELDRQGTIDRQKMGRKSYNRVIRLDSLDRELLIRVPQIYDAKTSDSKLIVQELVYGMKIDQLQERHKVDMPTLKKELTLKLVEVWLNVLLFENGFYHSDLHQGNMMVDLGRRVIPFSLLDFGMAGQLNQSQRQYFLMMAAGGELNNAKLMTEAMLGISNQTRNEVDEKTFAQLVEQKMQELKAKKMVLSPERWIAWALNKGLRFSSNIIGVSRGMTILDKLLKDAKSDTSILGVSRSLAKRNKWEVLSSLSESENFRFLDLLLMGRQAIFGGRQADQTPFEKGPTLAPMCRSVIMAR